MSEALARADRAKIILDDPLVKEAFARLEKDICEAWMRTGIRDKEGQHELLLMAQTARKFRAIFEEIVMTGEFEAQNLKAPKLQRVLERFGIYNP